MNIKNTIAALVFSLLTLGVSANASIPTLSQLLSSVRSAPQKLEVVIKTTSYAAGVALVGLGGYHAYQEGGINIKSVLLSGLGTALFVVPSIMNVEIKPLRFRAPSDSFY